MLAGKRTFFKKHTPLGVVSASQDDVSEEIYA